MSEEQRLRIKCNQYAKRLVALGEEDIVWEANPKLQSAALNINKCNLEVGQKCKLFFNPKNVNNKIIEVRAIVDDVVCVYRKQSI